MAPKYTSAKQEPDTEDIASLAQRDFSAFQNDMLGKREIAAMLERLPITADAKAVLRDLANITIKIGGKLIAIGRKVLSTILRLGKMYPNTLFGLIAGSVITFLIGTVPLIGLLLSAVLGPLLIALGIGMGAVADFTSSHLRARMDAIEMEYAVLRT